MVVGTLSLVKKGQTSGFSGHSHTVDTVHSGCSTQWNSGMVVGTLSLIQKSQSSGCSIQYAVDTVE